MVANAVVQDCEKQVRIEARDVSPAPNLFKVHWQAAQEGDGGRGRVK